MRPIDAKALRTQFMEVPFVALSRGELGIVLKVYEMIDNAPTIDAVQVIRCKDCAHYRPSPFGHRTIGWCKLDGKHRGQNFYCADGEMKAK